MIETLIISLFFISYPLLLISFLAFMFEKEGHYNDRIL